MARPVARADHRGRAAAAGQEREGSLIGVAAVTWVRSGFTPLDVTAGLDTRFVRAASGAGRPGRTSALSPEAADSAKSSGAGPSPWREAGAFGRIGGKRRFASGSIAIQATRGGQDGPFHQRPRRPGHGGGGRSRRGQRRAARPPRRRPGDPGRAAGRLAGRPRRGRLGRRLGPRAGPCGLRRARPPHRGGVRRRLRLALRRRGAGRDPGGDRAGGLPRHHQELCRRPAEFRARRRARPGAGPRGRDRHGRRRRGDPGRRPTAGHRRHAPGPQGGGPRRGNGRPLAEVAAAARAAAAAVRSLGLAVSGCTMPGGTAESRLAPGQAELGLGIHGEPGIERIALPPPTSPA